MKEKLLLFVNFSQVLTDEQLNKFIVLFRGKYPRFRCIKDVSSIDYTKQCVKLIIIETSNHYKEGSYTVFFKSSSGRVYESYLYTNESVY